MNPADTFALLFIGSLIGNWFLVAVVRMVVKSHERTTHKFDAEREKKHALANELNALYMKLAWHRIDVDLLREVDLVPVDAQATEDEG